jgi:hypothetical protein
MSEAWAYYDANTIEITGDVVAEYAINQIVRIVQTATVKYFLITAVNLVGGNTQLSINGGGVYTLTNEEITYPYRTTSPMAAYGVPMGFIEYVQIHGATSKTTPVDADELPIWDSADQFTSKKLTWSNNKATLKSYFDGLYAPTGIGASYVAHSLATAENDFLIASGSGTFVKKTLAETKTTLGLGSAAYTASTAYVTHALATAENDFLIASGSGAFVKKTLAETKTALGLGSAAYTASTAYVTHALATAENDFLIASGSGAFVKKTLAETKTALGLGTAAYTASADYPLLAGRAGGQTLKGGTGVADILKLQGTAGNGTAAEESIQLLVGNNGGTIAATVTNFGDVGFGTVVPGTHGNPVSQKYLDIISPGAAGDTATAVLGLGGNQTVDGNLGDINFYNLAKVGADKRVGVIRCARTGADNSSKYEIYTNNAGSWVTAATIAADGAFYVVGNCSALSFTDRTPAFVGDAITAIKQISHTRKREIDHTTLPAIAQSIYRNAGKETVGRDLGGMISVLTVAVQQLIARIETLEEA